MSLRLDWCTHEAAKYAVEHWHYSRRMPISKLVKIGVWGEGSYRGAVIFGMGTARHLVSRYGLKNTEGCELVRIALREHKAPVTRIVRIALSMLQRHCPGLRLVVSYADANQGHLGIIYQAGNWTYDGLSTPIKCLKYKGKLVHLRTWSAWRAEGKMPKVSKEDFVTLLPKFRYLMPLDKKMRRQIQALAKPYPTGAPSIENDAASYQPAEGGVIPTGALQSEGGE